MNVHVRRQACCSQDDQLGPLEMSFALQDGCTLKDFVLAVQASNFLQFSSSHTVMSLLASGHAIARVCSPYGEPRQGPSFLLLAEMPLKSIALGLELEFVFDPTIAP